MADKKGLNFQVTEDHTTQVPQDVFENAELKFPCEFPISVMGKNSNDYEDVIFSVLKKHVPELERSAVSSVFSGGNKYCSVRAKFTAKSREQLDELYKELTALKQVKWVL